MSDEVKSASVSAANAGVPLSATSSINGTPVVTLAAHVTIVNRIKTDLALANQWLEEEEAKVAAMFPKSAVLVMSVAAFVAGFLVKWIF